MRTKLLTAFGGMLSRIARWDRACAATPRKHDSLPATSPSSSDFFPVAVNQPTL